MPAKGFKQSNAHRRHIAQAAHRHHLKLRELLAHAPDAMRRRFKSLPPRYIKPDPLPTPIPPSASQITTPAFQRHAIYQFNADGAYYFKREQADTLRHLYKRCEELDLVSPLWCYTKSAHTEADLGNLPIRIPHSAIPALGARFQRFRFKEKKND
jgi:hypothetical protein